MESIYRELLKKIGEDPYREGLKKTPERAEEALKFLTRGYNQNLDEIVNGALFESCSDDMIIVRDIELYSLCEHHILPFIGKCHIGYIPDKKILGVSKVARIVDYFGRRLQIQERLTHQVSNTILEVTGCLGVGVVIEAQHLCMMMRGVEKQNSVMETSSMLGIFREDRASRSEFLSLINKK